MPEDRNGNDESNASDNPTLTHKRQPIAGENEGGAGTVKQNSADRRPHWADILMAVFTGLILLTYLTSDYFLWQQFKLTEKALVDSEASFEKTLRQMQAQTTAQQRAAGAFKSAADTAAVTLRSSITSFKQQVRPYVIVESMRINTKPTENVIAGIESVLKNTGTTPALNFRIRHTFTLQPRLPCSIPPLPFEHNSPQANIGAGLVRAVRVFGERGLSKTEVTSIENGTLFICYAGLFSYKDIFGEAHETEVCGYYKPPNPNTAVGEGDLFLWACTDHNRVR